MSFIGLLLNSHEDDILEDTLAANAAFLDSFYVLDGTTPNTVSEQICRSFPECRGYLTDADLSHPRFPEKPVCGYRQAIYEMAVTEEGFDNWFVLLHGDEVWATSPRDLPAAHPGADGFVCKLPFYFPRDGEPWDERPPLVQLHWRLGPGYPEFRMFHGAPHVAYDPYQRFNTRPGGLEHVVDTDTEIRHYLYRSPENQLARAQRHLETDFDPDNYRHVLDGHVYWTDERIAKYRAHPFYQELSG